MDTLDKQKKNTHIEQKDINQKNKETENHSSQLQNVNIHEINQLKQKILDNQKKENDIELRHLAYIENIKKNAASEIKNIKNIKKEQFFKNIMPIIDILEDTLSLSKKSNLEKEPLVQGIQLTLQSLLKIMYKFGVKVEGQKNETFNPIIHNVILTENSKEIQPNHVLRIIRKGFSFKNTILRKASIILSKI